MIRRLPGGTLRAARLRNDNRETCHEKRGEQHPEGREDCRLGKYWPDFRPAGIEPSGEKDVGEGNDPDSLGYPGIIKVDTPGTLRPGKHPYQKKDQESGNAKPSGHLVGEDTDQDQYRDDKEDVFNRGLHPSFLPQESW